MIKKGRNAYVGSTPISELALRKDKDVTEKAIPGSSFHADKYTKDRYFLLKSGKATPHSKLSNGDYCKRIAKELYIYLVANTPAGIFNGLVIEIIKGDVSCSNYYAEYLGLDKSDIYKKAKAVGE